MRVKRDNTSPDAAINTPQDIVFLDALAERYNLTNNSFNVEKRAADDLVMELMIFRKIFRILKLLRLWLGVAV